MSPTLKGLTAGIGRAYFTPDGTRVVSDSQDGTVRVWDAGTGEPRLTIRGHANSVYIARDANGRPIQTSQSRRSEVDGVDVSPDSERIASGGDRTVRVWDATSGRELHVLAGHTELVRSVCFSPDSERIASGGDRTVRVWDATTGKERLRIDRHTRLVFSVCFSPDGKRIVSAGVDKMVKVWDVESGRGSGGATAPDR